MRCHQAVSPGDRVEKRLDYRKNGGKDRLWNKTIAYMCYSCAKLDLAAELQIRGSQLDLLPRGRPTTEIDGQEVMPL